jgi:hypothetical protein
MTPREPVRRACPPLHPHTSLCVRVCERQRVPKSDHDPGFGICGLSRYVYASSSRVECFVECSILVLRIRGNASRRQTPGL